MIKAGDVVMVVRGHICDVGRIAIVADVVAFTGWRCTECGHEESGLVEGALFQQAGTFGALVSWLKKLRPRNEPESIDRDEEITA